MGLVLAAFAAPAVAADLKVAVVDFDNALMSSDAGKKWADSINASLKGPRDQMATLKKQVEDLGVKAQKDAAIMSEKDKKDMQQEMSNKIQQYQRLEQDGQRSLSEARQQFLERMYPKLEAAIDELRKSGNYTLILNRQTAVYVDPAFDLTAKITEKLNAAGNAPAAK
jgi:outer membrane protein